MNVLIVGSAGRLGRALVALAQSRATVFGCDQGDDCTKPASHADLILLCVPSWETRSVARTLAAHIDRAAVISFAKGIEQQTLATVAEILQQELPRHTTGVCIGPMISEEMIHGGGSAGVVGSSETRAFQMVQDLFTPQQMMLKYSPEYIGVAFAGALKNVYALTLGIADALGWSSNMKGYLMGCVLEESDHVLGRLGVDPQKIPMTARASDLITCSYSPLSRNRTTGQRIVETGVCDKKSEGYHSIEGICKRAEIESDPTQFKIITATRRVVCDNEPAAELFKTLLT